MRSATRKQPSTLPSIRLVALSAMLLLASCGGSSGAGAAVEAELVRMRAELAQLDSDKQALANRLEQEAPRAGAYRRLEFLGIQPALPGEARAFEVLETSATPEPKTSDYTDCVVVSRCAMLDAQGERTDQEALVAMAVFHDRKRTRAAFFGVGQRVRAQLVAWQEMPESVHSIQRVDETDAFDLPMFAALAPEPDFETKTFTPTPPGAGHPSAQESIRAGIAAIEARLAAHGSFEQWHEELAPLREDLRRQHRAAGGPLRKDRRFCLRNISYVNYRPGDQWPAPQIAYFTNLRDQLAARGIDLIVVPFPEQEIVTALQFVADAPKDGVVSAYREQWLLEMQRAGVEVLDLREALVAATAEFPFVYYDAEDGHPADGGIVVAARQIAARLRRYADVPASLSSVQLRTVAHGIPERHTKFPPRAFREKCYASTMVLAPDGAALKRTTPDAPFLIVGDSFTAVPYHYEIASANISAHVTKETGVPMRWLGVGGSAPQLMVHMARSGPQLLEGVRAVVYVFREGYMFRHDEEQAKFRWQVTELPK